MAIGYSYTVNAHWQTRRQGTVKVDSEIPAVGFSAPVEFQGETGFWTPEHFFLAAIASCFITTFRAIADLSKFEHLGLKVSVEGTVGKGEGGFSFTQITIKPSLDVASDADVQRGERLLEKTEKACLVSRSLKSEIRMEAEVGVAAIHSA